MRPDGAGARDVDDRSARARRHARADERHQPERRLEVERHHLVEERLRGLERGRRERRRAGVVDEDVDPPRPRSRRLPRGDRGPPTATRCRGSGQARRPRASTSRATASQLSARRETMTSVGAPAGEGEDHLPAETPASAGHENRPAGEVEERNPPSSQRNVDHFPPTGNPRLPPARRQARQPEQAESLPATPATPPANGARLAGAGTRGESSGLEGKVRTDPSGRPHGLRNRGLDAGSLTASHSIR